MKLIFLRQIISILLCFFLFNCTLLQRSIFLPKEKKLQYQKIPKTLTIEKFQDLRAAVEMDETYGFILIPFVFWETLESPRWNGNNAVSGKLELVLPHALKKEILSYNNLNEVYVATESDSKEADYLVRGKILKTYHEHTSTLYGLSIFGIIFWAVGIPYEYSLIEMETEFELVEVKSNKILLTKKYPRRDSSLRNVYMKSYHHTMINIWQNQLESFAKDCMEVLSK